MRRVVLCSLSLAILGAMVDRANAVPLNTVPSTSTGGGADKFPPIKPPPVYSPTFGGAGGSAVALNCDWVGGLMLDVGSYVEGLTLLCVDSNGDWASRTPHVGTNSRMPQQLVCPRDFHPVGLYGRAGSYVDALGLICSNGRSSLPVLPTVGGNGGVDFSWQCPADYSFAGLSVSAGSVVDALQIYCRYDP